MKLELEPGTFCAIGDRVIEIDGADSLSHVMARDVGTGEVFRAEISKLRALPASLKRQEAGFVPDAAWKRCTAIAKDLQPFAGLPRIPNDDLARIAKRHSLSIRQVQRLRKKFERDRLTSSLVSGSAGKPAGTNGLPIEVHLLINRIIRKHFFRRERPAKVDIIERVRSVCRRLGLAPPSPNAVLRRIEANGGYDADAQRYGRKAAKQMWQPRPGQLSTFAPLDLIQIDHTRVDVMVLSEDRQTVLGRPWVTFAIDVCSRVVLGMYLSMDTPSSVSVSLCIEHAVLPKPEEREEPGTWPMYGKPKCILVDNGKDLRSLALKRGCEEHGIELKWRPVRTPHYGGHIERLNGTLMRLCHLLPGTTFSNIKEKGDYDSAGRARLTLPELQAWMVEKICRYYHARKNRGIGVPPRVAWERAFTDAQGKVRPPPLVADPMSFRVDFLPYVFRKVPRTGIELISRYWHEDLGPVLNHPEAQMVRYDPRDDRCVWVRLPDDRLVEVPAIAGPALGHPKRRERLDAETAARLNQEIDTHFERCDAIEEQAERATREARKSHPSKKTSAKKAASRGNTRSSSVPKDPAVPPLAEVPPAIPTPASVAAAANNELVEAVAALSAASHDSPPPPPMPSPEKPAQRATTPPSAAPPPLKHRVLSPLPVEDWN